jgi:predicted nucleic acid-binding protein
MCIILDANCVGLFVSGDPSMEPVSEYLKKKGHLVFGGSKLKLEYERHNKFNRILIELLRTGQLLRLQTDAVDKKEIEIRHEVSTQSDDPHILAIAALSNARVLVSHDQPLHRDFTTTKFFKPKGKIYQDETHAHLLARLPKCA